MKVMIYRPINGIPINGNEYVLDENGDPMIFDSEDDARSFLADYGIGETEIEEMGVGFEEVTEERK